MKENKSVKEISELDYINLICGEEHFFGSLCGIPTYINKMEENKMIEIREKDLDSNIEIKAEVKKNKHLLLNDALEALEKLPNKVDNLLNKINYTEREDAKECPSQESSFVNVLDNSPKKIYEIIDSVIIILEKIDQVLF